MNEESHWDQIASDYNEEIFDVFKSDRKKVLPRYFRKHANRNHRAIDFGCGTGKAFPYLSPYFKQLIAVDISSECLAIAKQRPYTNISYKQLDLSKARLSLQKADFIFCCNVIMLPEIEKNEVMIKNVQRSLNQGGSALLVLPALDSILYSSWRLIDWYRQEGVSPEEIPASELSYFKGNKRDILRGIVHIDGRQTKHYSESELHVLFSRARLRITALDKVEYDWDTEFSAPPKWMGEPYPWDWLVECRNDG
jgi:SAM-dependent methyltransferase